MSIYYNQQKTLTANDSWGDWTDFVLFSVNHLTSASYIYLKNMVPGAQVLSASNF